MTIGLGTKGVVCSSLYMRHFITSFYLIQLIQITAKNETSLKGKYHE